LVHLLSRHSPVVMRPWVPGRRTVEAPPVGWTGPRLAMNVWVLVSVTKGSCHWGLT
jgi:hypothetical protein